MDGIMDGQKYWRCQNGHVLGLIRRRKVSAQVQDMRVNYHTNVLLIFRSAVDLACGELTRDEVKSNAGGYLYGRMLLGFQWKCNIPGCGCAGIWHPDAEATDWLKKRYGKKEGA